MTQNAGTGHSVLLVVKVRGSDTVASVSGLGATWSKINSIQRNVAAFFQEMWIGTSTAGGTKAITVTMTGGSQYSAWAQEYDLIASAASGGTAKASSGSPTLTVSGLADGEMLIAAATCSAVLTAPSAPWILASGNGGDVGVVYQLTRSASNQTATWTSSSAQWGASAAILTPATATSEPLVMVI